MMSLSHPLCANTELLLLLLLLASSVVKATLNLTLQYELREDSPPGTVIGDVKVDSGLAAAHSPGVVDRMRFRLRSTSEHVSVNEVTGVMVLSFSLDRATLCPYADHCRLIADVVVRPSSVFHIVRVTVSVLSVNRHAPRYASPSVEFDVPSSAPPGTAWALPAADDPDGGTEGVQTYRIAPPTTSTFALDVVLLPDGSRDIQLRLLKSLNRSVESYSLTVVAADGGVPPRTGSLSVLIRVSDATDHVPRFDHVTYDVTLTENSPLMTVVKTVRATSDRRDASIRYSFDDQTTRRYGQMFAISNTTGDVLVVGTVDREHQASCLLTLMAVDVARPASLPAYSRMRITLLDVNDNRPTLTVTTLSPPGGRWAEVHDGAARGAFLAHVAVADPDTGNASVVDCAVNSTDFRLSPLGAGGDYQLTTAKVFGRGHLPVYFVAITCTDRGLPPLSDSRSLSVLVIDAGPQFPAEVVSTRISTGVQLHARVVKLNATTSDVGPEAEIEYSMSLVAGHVDALTIDSRTGWVTTRVLVGRDATNSTFVYRVTATDRGDPPLSAVITLHVHVVDSGGKDVSVRTRSSSTTHAPFEGVADDIRSDVIIASVVCATVIVLALITVVAVVFCCRRRWCVVKDQSCSNHHSSDRRSCSTLDVVTGSEPHSSSQRPDVVITGLDDDVTKYYTKASSSQGSLYSVAPSSDKDSFSSTRPLRPHQHPHPHQHPSHPAATAAAGGDERRRRRSSDSTTTSSNNKPFVFSLIPPSPHNHLILDGGQSSHTKPALPAVFDHESDSGVSGSLTESGRALADDIDTAATAHSPTSPSRSPPYSLTGSYCPARAADARRAHLAQVMPPSNRRDQPASRRTRSTERTILELPSYDTYV